MCICVLLFYSSIFIIIFLGIKNTIKSMISQYNTVFFDFLLEIIVNLLFYLSFIFV